MQLFLIKDLNKRVSKLRVLFLLKRAKQVTMKLLCLFPPWRRRHELKAAPVQEKNRNSFLYLSFAEILFSEGGECWKMAAPLI